MKILLKIAYVGTAYCGYQVQPNGVTVQERLNEATRAVFGVDCDVVGCSRTDSGVHARAFCATIAEKGKPYLQTTVPVARVPRALNVHLPDDIAVLDACLVPDDFHARYGVRAKEYEYVIYNAPERDPFLVGRAWHIPKPFTDEDVAAMNVAAAAFVGEHDFSALRDGDDGKSPVRHIYSASVVRQGERVLFRVAANGFLYHMVRVMTGTLAEVGRGKIPPEEIAVRLAACDRSLFGATAPAQGLYLDRVFYPEKYFE
ncbi:MAG: tRNA pseudouridine(38-40) synthase TruA [Ruminococcaceae bacterium]|nr:tRNA pseudouridine(38-40) synthase TruA [Oscillospiraceae bacterium]